MKAQSSDYIQLQTLYKSKAREDVQEVLDTVRASEAEYGRTPSSIPTSEVEAFCKNAGYIKLVRGRPFHVAQPVLVAGLLVLVLCHTAQSLGAIVLVTSTTSMV